MAEPVFLQARVIQKVATTEEWEDINFDTLIKGEMFIYENVDGVPINLKFGDGINQPRDIPYFFDASIRVPFFGSATPSSTPTPSTGSGFWIATEAGTYTNYGGVVLPANSLGVITRVGTSYGLIVASIDLSGYASKTYVDNIAYQSQSTYDKLNNILIYSINKLDKSKAKRFTQVLTNGGTTTNNSYSFVLVPVKPNTQYTYKGFSTLYIGNEYNNLVDALAVYNGDFSTINASNKTASIADNTAQRQIWTWTTGANTYFVALNITNGGAFSLENTAMLYEGDDVDQPYEPYQNDTNIDPEKIEGGVVGTDEFETVENQVVNNTSLLENLVDVYSHYDGTADTQLGSTYILNAVGDFIEWVGKDNRVAGDQLAQSLYLFGTYGQPSNSILGYYSNTTIRLRQHITSDPYKIWDFTGNPNFIKGDFNKFKLLVVSTGWELFLNDVSLGIISKEAGLNIDSFAYAGYVPSQPQMRSKVDLKYVIINVGGNETTFKSMGGFSGSTNVVDVLSLKIQPDDDNSYSDVFVTFEPQGTTDSQPRFIIYSKMSANKYVGFVVSRYLRSAGDYTDGTNSDQYRLTGGAIYTFDGNVMIGDGINVLTSGENEGAVRRGSDNLTGGVHGNELLSSVLFFINGVNIGDISTLSAFTLTPCKTFKYFQVSDIKQALEGQTTILQHFKETEIKPGGVVKSKNSYKAPAAATFTIYGTLVCVENECCDFALNDEGLFRTMTHSSANEETHYMGVYNAKTIRYWSEDIGVSVIVSGNALKWRKESGEPIVRVDDVNKLNANALVTTKDNNNYGKYYRTNTGLSIGVNDVLEFEGIIKVNKL